MLISRNLHMKSSEVSIKTRSPPASLSFKGQATKHTTVKWSIKYYWTDIKNNNNQKCKNTEDINIFREHLENRMINFRITQIYIFWGMYAEKETAQWMSVNCKMNVTYMG